MLQCRDDGLSVNSPEPNRLCRGLDHLTRHQLLYTAPRPHSHTHTHTHTHLCARRTLQTTTIQHISLVHASPYSQVPLLHLPSLCPTHISPAQLALQLHVNKTSVTLWTQLPPQCSFFLAATLRNGRTSLSTSHFLFILSHNAFVVENFDNSCKSL